MCQSSKRLIVTMPRWVQKKEGAQVRPIDAAADDETISTLGTSGTLVTQSTQSNKKKEAQTVASATSSATNQDLAMLAQFKEMLPALQAMVQVLPETQDTTILQTSLLSAARLFSPSSQARVVGDKN